jgi:uncharacterized protein YjbJ (UPF0337 family)
MKCSLRSKNLAPRFSPSKRLSPDAVQRSGLVASERRWVMTSGTKDKVEGRVKEAAGALTGDEKLKSEGKADQFAGKVKDAVGAVVDKTKDALKH